ncbi:SGNH/GDSL hydrolase family protein [Myxococcus sp. K38C18041901]|uniref:SGNH/GDSL hydrolase family protein n=1 Tax=Myxococcus guangdongensis TaxID=2906760 RepID=UPI0020A7030B|nr:SGNH/GDSL hydrolase family protein [Myxococcus guangdongensis]MCP3061159.1 SGNH/GDSL hydrolase family protein [Myxococcus guangdongensis]
MSSLLGGMFRIGFVIMACVVWACGEKPSLASPHWLPAFTAPMHPSASATMGDALAGPSFRDQTVCMFVRPTLAGPRLRLVLSNQYGAQLLQVAAVRVGLRVQGVSIDPTTDRQVRFAGAASVSIPPGRTATSEPVELAVDGLRDVAVSLYFLERSGAVSWHLEGTRSTYVSASSNHTAAASFVPALTTRSLYFLAALHVDAAPGESLVVAFGDSITDGVGTTVDEERSWPARLSQRLRARGGRAVGVLNAGLSGNRLLDDGYGPNGLRRFERDVLAQRGVKAVLLLEGVNDIGRPGAASGAERITQAYEQLIQRARARGLKVYGGTLTPMQGHPYFTAANETTRQAVNQWIRTAGRFDAVIDFDAAVREPANPHSMRAALTVDGLHPNDAGHALMAEAVDLRLLE